MTDRNLCNILIFYSHLSIILSLVSGQKYILIRNPFLVVLYNKQEYKEQFTTSRRTTRRHTTHIYLKTNRVVFEDIGDSACCGRSVRQYHRCTEHSRRKSIPLECIVDFCIHTPNACTAIGTLACNPQAN